MGNDEIGRSDKIVCELHLPNRAFCRPRQASLTLTLHPHRYAFDKRCRHLVDIFFWSSRKCSHSCHRASITLANKRTEGMTLLQQRKGGHDQTDTLLAMGLVGIFATHQSCKSSNWSQ